MSRLGSPDRIDNSTPDDGSASLQGTCVGYSRLEDEPGSKHVPNDRETMSGRRLVE